MNRVILLSIAVVLVGCSTVASYIPSLQSCEKVKYERVGATAKIEAECYVPR